MSITDTMVAALHQLALKGIQLSELGLCELL